MSTTGDENEKGAYHKCREVFKQEKKRKIELDIMVEQEKNNMRKEKNMAISRADKRMEDGDDGGLNPDWSDLV